MQSSVRQILVSQLLLICTAALVCYWFFGLHGSLSAGYGGAVVLASALLLAKRLEQAGRFAQDEQKNTGMALLYAGAVERFLLVLIAFAIGMGLLKLSPLALIIGFAFAQMGYIVSQSNSRINRFAR